MAIPAIMSGIDNVSDHEIRSPPSAKTTTTSPSNAELDAIELPDYGLSRSKSKSRSHNETNPPTRPSSPKEYQASFWDQSMIPNTPVELERSQPSTPVGDNVANVTPTFYFPKMNKWRVLSACMEYFGNGINDSAPGALIPYIEAWYDIGYAVVSTIWIANAVG